MTVPHRGAAPDDSRSATVILLRHGRSTANGAGILAGRSAGVDVDSTGAQQASALIDRLAECRIARIVSSPMLRCLSTVAPLAAALGLDVTVDDRLAEVDYGDWTGRRLADLATEPLWRIVQTHPSAAVFPNGEALAAVSARAVAAARSHAARDDGSGAVLICSHGDVIASILADALGMHQDLFQRLVVSPASVSVIRYTSARAFVEHVNDTGSLAGIGMYSVAAPRTGAVDGEGAPDVEPAVRAQPGAAAADPLPDEVVGGDPGIRTVKAQPQPRPIAGSVT